jgi:hypothetical protein
MLAQAGTPLASSSSLTPMADTPRLLESVVGRLLELVVFSVEGARERLRARISVH